MQAGINLALYPLRSTINKTMKLIMNIVWKYYLRKNGQKHWFIETDEMIDETSKDSVEKSIEEQLEAIL